MTKIIFFFLLTVYQTHLCSAGCSGVVNLPLKLGRPSTHVITGAKSYGEKTVTALALRLVGDIPGLSIEYARVMAEDALYIEENYEITYRFFISAGTAKISQFKVKSTTLLDNKVNMDWNILKAESTYTAQRDITVHARRRRRWIGGGRRRCARQKSPRGITKAEIKTIQSSLTAVLNRIGQKSNVFVLKRKTTVKQVGSSIGSCPAWKHVLNIKRTCSKRIGAVPKPYKNPPVKTKERKISPKRYIPRRCEDEVFQQGKIGSRELEHAKC